MISYDGMNIFIKWFYSSCRHLSEDMKKKWITAFDVKDKAILTVFGKFPWGHAHPQLVTLSGKKGTYIKMVCNIPIPRIESRPIIKTILKTPNERHNVPIRLSLQTRPTPVTQTVTRETWYEHPAVDGKLAGMTRKLSDAGDDVVQVTSHLGEVEGDEEFESCTELLCSIVGTLKLGCLPVVTTHVHGQSVAGWLSEWELLERRKKHTLLWIATVLYRLSSHWWCRNIYNDVLNAFGMTKKKKTLTYLIPKKNRL